MTLQRVESITTEDEPDLVVSFALTPEATESLTLLRSPQLESTLPKHERGVSVSTPGAGDEDRDLLQRLHWEESTVIVSTERHEYRLDVSAVASDDVDEAKAVLRKMAADGAVYVNGV